jgi:5-methylcytosine-specific restriction endonuclease McrA
VRSPDDPYPDALIRVIQTRIAGDETAALAEITTIGFTPPQRRVERWPAMSVIAGVYARDHYHCRYCGERVILTAVMRLVARLYPEQFPYHPNWKADATHPAFISRSATLDHVRPIADGGDSLVLDNLVTACWNCNRRKGDLRLEEIGWTLVEPRDASWRGLTELYRPLWDASGQPVLSDDEHAWMRAIDRTHAQP